MLPNTMAFAAYLAELQEEASCPLCLEYLRDPGTLECGHNFCLSCIHQCWEELQDVFPCPVCFHHCPNKNLRRNIQLCHIIDIVNQLPTRKSEKERWEEELLCKKHNQVLGQFCEEDLKLLCPQCRVSSDHQGHALFPIERAAATHRKKLKSYIKTLKMQIEDAEMGCEIQKLQYIQVRFKMENWKKDFCHEFEELKSFLRKEHVATHGRLRMQEEDVQRKLFEIRSQISSHLPTVKTLLSEIAERYLQADLNLLTSIESLHNRYKHLKRPAVFSYELQDENCTLPPHYFGLQKMISMFQVNLTLNPESAHPDLIISKDRKSAIFRAMTPNDPGNPQVFTSSPAVWSWEGFDAGRHFWQVEVRGTGEWSLGVCKESFPRDALLSMVPNNGCWYFRQSTSYGSRDTVQVMRTGIFLDYELGEISFYDWNTRSYLFTFTDKFNEKLMPFFSVGPSSNSLTLSMIIEE